MDQLLRSAFGPIGLGTPGARSACAIVDRRLGCDTPIPSPPEEQSRPVLGGCSEETVGVRNAHREAAPAGERGPRVQRHWNTVQVDWSGSVRASAGFQVIV